MGLGVSLEVIFFPMVSVGVGTLTTIASRTTLFSRSMDWLKTNGVLAESMNVAVAEQARSLDPLAQD